MEPRADGALGDREAIGDLLQAEVEVIVRDDDVAVVVRQLAEGVAHALVTLASADAEVGVDAIGVVHRRERRELFPLEPFDEASAVTAGTFLVKLEVREGNHAARRFYSSMGYAETGVIEGYYQGRDNAVRMSRDLSISKASGG